MGVILSTYDTWDDPPSKAFESWESKGNPPPMPPTHPKKQGPNEALSKWTMVVHNPLVRPYFLETRHLTRGKLSPKSQFLTSVR